VRPLSLVYLYGGPRRRAGGGCCGSGLFRWWGVGGVSGAVEGGVMGGGGGNGVGRGGFCDVPFPDF